MLGFSICRSGRGVGGMQKGGPLQADIHKRRLHARQHPAYLAPVDLANQATAPGALNIDLLQGTVFYQRHACFPRCYIDQYFFAHDSLENSDSSRL